MLDQIKSRVQHAITDAKDVTVSAASSAREQLQESIAQASDASISASADTAIRVLKQVIEKVRRDADFRTAHAATIDTRVRLGVVEIGISLSVHLPADTSPPASRDVISATPPMP